VQLVKGQPLELSEVHTDTKVEKPNTNNWTVTFPRALASETRWRTAITIPRSLSRATAPGLTAHDTEVPARRGERLRSQLQIGDPAGGRCPGVVQGRRLPGPDNPRQPRHRRPRVEVPVHERDHVVLPDGDPDSGAEAALPHEHSHRIELLRDVQRAPAVRDLLWDVVFRNNTIARNGHCPSRNLTIKENRIEPAKTWSLGDRTLAYMSADEVHFGWRLGRRRRPSPVEGGRAGIAALSHLASTMRATRRGGRPGARDTRRHRPRKGRTASASSDTAVRHTTPSHCPKPRRNGARKAESGARGSLLEKE